MLQVMQQVQLHANLISFFYRVIFNNNFIINRNISDKPQIISFQKYHSMIFIC